MTDYWYRTDTERMSDAVDRSGIKKGGSKIDDIIAERTRENNTIEEKVYTYGSIVNEPEQEKLDKIEATTRKFDIDLDYDVNSGNISEFGAQLEFVFDNIDFGIIRRPVQNIDVRKEISYVQLKLTNGQIMVEGDPRKDDIKYLRFLPDGNVHIELDQELIQGATLIIRYDIIVSNKNLEIDYNDKDYYIYGIASNEDNWEIATISNLYDYVTNDMIFESSDINKNWQQITIDEDLEEKQLLSKDAYETAKKYNQVLETDFFKGMQPGEERAVSLEVSRMLSNSADDIIFPNDIEVNEVTGRRMEHNGNYTIPGNYVPSNGPDKEGDEDYVYLTITGPTGENRNYIPYILLGITGFIVLAIGIIVIKKNVL